MKHKKRQRHKYFPSVRFSTKSGRQKRKSVFESLAGWFALHKPVFLFLLVFSILMGLFYLFMHVTPFYNNRFLSGYHRFIAYLSGTVLAFLGQDITVTDTSIFSSRFSVSIVGGCDAIEPTVLFICAVLAFPAPFLRKIPGILVGTPLLMILNLIRIVTLFLIGVYLPRFFDAIHIEGWQALFIFLALIFWILWLLWAMQNQTKTRGVSG